MCVRCGEGNDSSSRYQKEVVFLKEGPTPFGLQLHSVAEAFFFGQNFHFVTLIPKNSTSRADPREFHIDFLPFMLSSESNVESSEKDVLCEVKRVTLTFWSFAPPTRSRCFSLWSSRLLPTNSSVFGCVKLKRSQRRAAEPSVRARRLLVVHASEHNATATMVTGPETFLVSKRDFA